MISAVKILLVDAGVIGESAFFCNNTFPVLLSIRKA